MSGKILINELDLMFSSQSAMYSQFRVDVRKDSLQSVVRVWQPDVGIVVESPKQWHVPFDAQVCAAQSGTHVGRFVLFDAPVMHPFVKYVIVLFVPQVECADETVLVHPGDAVGKSQQLSRSLQFRLLCQIAPHGKHLVELAQLYRNESQCFSQPLTPVYHCSVYLEAVGLQPVDTLHVIPNRLVRDILTPQHTTSQDIADYHQSEMPTPVGRVHLNRDLLVLRYFLDVPHTLQVTANRPLTHAIPQGELSKRLLALDVVCYNLGVVTANTSFKTATADFALITLSATWTTNIIFKTSPLISHQFFFHMSSLIMTFIVPIIRSLGQKPLKSKYNNFFDRFMQTRCKE